MANASADKMKLMVLRHGEKAVMGVTAALCIFLMYSAATQPTITLTPEEIKKGANAVDSNLNTQQKPEDILKRLEDAGIKNPGFEQQVDEKIKNKLNPIAYRARGPWITPEPGAGLIRDRPELIAPTELVAYPGRGGGLVFELNEDGERIPDTTKKADDEGANPRRKRRNQSAQRKEEEAQKKAESERQAKLKRLAGAGKESEKTEETKEEAAPSSGPHKEITQGLRWVAITGVLDYAKLRDNYLTALKRKEIAFPHFKELQVERQELESDGKSWSEWSPLDAEKNQRVLYNIPEEEEEWTPDSARISALVDPLPFLRAGFWERVHVARLISKEKLDALTKVVAPPPVAADPGMAGAMPGSSEMPVMPEPIAMPPPDAGSSAMMMAGPMPMGEGAYGGNSNAPETANFEHNDSETIMVRGLDFTVEPDKTYRYHVRIVVFNPNKDREDVTPGVDTKALELFGPWSEPTETATMPADVAAYAMQRAPSAGRRGEKVQFQVAKWMSEDGFTLVKTFDAGPGEIIGEVTPAYVPATDGTEKKSKKIDFTSRQVVLDVFGGNQALPAGLGINGRIEIPALALMIGPDGSVLLRSQFADVSDDVRKEMDDNYKREITESGKKRKRSTGAAGAGSGRRRRR